MQPYKRKRRTRRDMITLGGWLFADLLLGLSMLFLVANTVGAPPPAPTPTPMPDYFATAESQIASNQVENQQTVVALESDLANSESQNTSLQATRDAEATNQAMSAEQRATADAQATQDAILVQGTVSALSTEQAANQSSQAELNSQYATTVAEATEVARQVEANSTEQAELRAAATENANSGANAQSTNAALQTNLATSEAGQSSAQATSESAVATSDAANNEVLQAQEQAQLNTLDPNAVPETIEVDLNGVLGNNSEALDDARDELHGVLDPYVESQSCRIGFVLISARAPDIDQGIRLADRVAELIQADFPELLPVTQNGQEPTLASESIALPNTTPTGEVQLLLFMSSGCQPASGLSEPVAWVREAE